MNETIRYSRTLYSDPGINKAVATFQTHFDVSVLRETPDFVEVQFCIEEGHMRRLVGEFNNYLIQVKNQNGLFL